MTSWRKREACTGPYGPKMNESLSYPQMMMTFLVLRLEGPPVDAWWSA